VCWQSQSLLPYQGGNNDFCHDGNNNEDKSVGNEVEPFGVLSSGHRYHSQRFDASTATGTRGSMRGTFPRMNSGRRRKNPDGLRQQVVFVKPERLASALSGLMAPCAQWLLESINTLLHYIPARIAVGHYSATEVRRAIC
jgi:hypothetical protein